MRLRVLFAAAPAAEAEVRRRILGALRRGGVDGPDGVTTHWQFHSAQASSVSAAEAAHGERLVRS